MTERSAIIDISRYHPAAGQREALLDVMRRMASKAAAAEGCFGAQVCEADQDSEELVAVSRWASRDAMDAFASSPGFVEERERFTALLARPSEHEHLRPL